MNFTVSVNDSQLQLSHVVTAAEESSGLNGIASVEEGDLVYGVISNGVANMRKVTAADDFIATITVSAAWDSAPENEADIAYLNGKKFTATFTATAQAYLLEANNAFAGVENVATGTVQFTIGYDGEADPGEEWTFTAGTYTNRYVHIEPTSVSATETGTTGSLAVTSIGSLS